METCPSCGRELPGEFPFCPYCGGALTALPSTQIQEERKIVSIVFCDLVGFTAASERQDPEDVRARIRPYHARIRQEIERYGGTVEKFVGDAVMAAFGAPVAHEDDVERAVRAGLNILKAIAELNEAVPELDLKVRVGINTGEAVVALDVHPERGEGLVTGDVVNTAARIQSVAPVNGVAVGEQTYRTTSHVFVYEPLDAAVVKGKAETLSLWRAMAVRERYGSDSVVREYTTPFVGRELEKTLLIGTFERGTQRRAVQFVTVVGEPGVGKTRLAAELFSYIDAKPEIIRWRQGRCLPYGEGITFWALGEIVKHEAAILDSDSAEVAATKLDVTLSSEEPDRQWLLQRLAPLVGLETESSAERQESFTAWRRYLENLAAVRPTILVFEDLHWADDALLAFLEYLTEWSEGVPLFVLCTARPELYERRLGWAAGRRNAQTINLAPLSDEETSELVSHLISTAVLTPELKPALLERAGGNPLYAEEFVRLLAYRGLAADESALPDSLQALIAARLDTLPPERKSLLQDAAVVGKVFWAGAVTEMGDRKPDEVELALHELARKELVRPTRTSSMGGESEYAFWHLVVRDVAYSQIPRAERARRHRAAAAWIEHKGGDRVEDLAEVLAHHYLQALDLAEAAGDTMQATELVDPARRFLLLAGERALGLDAALAEARLARALALTPAHSPERPELLVRWADAAFQTGRLNEAAEALVDALAYFRAHGETEAAAEALQLRSRVGMRLGEEHVAPATEAVELLERNPHGPALVAARAQLAHAQFIAGHYTAAISAAEDALTLADALGLPEAARALSYRGISRAYRGDADGITDMERALELLLDQGAAQDAAVLQNNLQLVLNLVHGPADSLAAFERNIAFCKQRGLDHAATVSETNCPGLLVELGRAREALERARRYVSALQTMGNSYDLLELGSVDLTIRLALGEDVSRTEIESLAETARASHGVDLLVLGLAAAAAALTSDSPDEARLLLSELDEKEGARETTYYRRQLAAMVRAALAAGDNVLAGRLTERLEPYYPIDEHALCSARAQLGEAAGEYVDAAALYAEAAERWREFGNVHERAYALLGQGRCLTALRQPEAALPLREARELLASMGYKPALAETEALLGESEATAV